MGFVIWKVSVIILTVLILSLPYVIYNSAASSSVPWKEHVTPSSAVLEEASRLSSDNKRIQSEIMENSNRGFFGSGQDINAIKEFVLKYKYNRERYNELRKTKEGASLDPMPVVYTYLNEDEMPYTKSELSKRKKEQEASGRYWRQVGNNTLIVILAVVIFIVVFFVVRFLLITIIDRANRTPKVPDKFDY